MAQAVNAIQQGFDFQARVFWLRACEMLGQNSRIKRVGFEVKDAPGFDDVVVHYDPPIRDRDQDCQRQYHQAKFHVDQAHSVTANDLTDPAFIGSQQTSLLQRVQKFLRVTSRENRACTLHLWTTAAIPADDPLALLIDNDAGGFRLEKLASASRGTTLGALRTRWRGHLGLRSDEELMNLLKPLRIHQSVGSLSLLMQALNVYLPAVGLAALNPDTPLNPYDDLIRKLGNQGRKYFTADELRAECKAAGLIANNSTGADRPHVLGIRSFRPWSEFLDSEANAVLSLLDRFEDRMLRQPHTWQLVVKEIAAFLRKNIEQKRRNELFLCTHQTIAFAAGYAVPVKAGVSLAINQSTQNGRQTWDVSTAGKDANVRIATESLGSDGQDIVLTVSATHDVREDTLKYVKAQVPSAGVLVHVHPQSNPTSASIKGGAEAAAWCNKADKALVEARKKFKGTIHVFAASPNALLFALGRNAQNWGRIQLYEFTFNDADQRTYTPSAVLPLA